MAGGQGARLRPLTYRVPKPLVEVGGRPLVHGVLDRMASAMVDKITMVVNYKADMIEDNIGDSWGGIPVDYLREDEPMGTAGSLRRLDTLLPRVFLVSNADLVTDFDLGLMAAAHVGSGADMTIAVRKVNHAIPYGVVEHIGDRVYSIMEKPVSHHTVSAGMYAITPGALGAIPREGAFDMPALVNELAGSGRVLSVEVDGIWRDVGRHEDLREVDEFLSRGIPGKDKK